MITRGEGGGQKLPFFDYVIFGWPLITIRQKEIKNWQKLNKKISIDSKPHAVYKKKYVVVKWVA